MIDSYSCHYRKPGHGFFKLGGDGNMFMASLILKVAEPEPAPIFTFSSSQEVFFLLSDKLHLDLDRGPIRIPDP